MGLTKQYLRYNPVAQFGVIGSFRCNISFLQMRSTKSRFVAVGAVENVIVWDTRTSEKIFVLQGENHEVSCLAASPDCDNLAVGYSDGSIKIFSLITGEASVTFNGHRSAVSCLTYSGDGTLLGSGAHDTDVVVWDLINESGLYRLKGHKGIVTQCYFVKKRNMFITSSKDTFIKWWDLDTQHCFKTMVGHRAEVWAFLLSADENRLITGSSDSELRVWEIRFIESKDDTTSPNHKVKKGSTCVHDDWGDTERVAMNVPEANEEKEVICRKLGSVFRKGRGRVVSLQITPDGRHIACHGKEKTLEVYRLSTERELQMKMKKKIKKARQTNKKLKSNIQEDDVTVELTLDDELVFIGSAMCMGKINSLDITTTTSSGDANIVALLQNNQIELLNAQTSLLKLECSSLRQLFQQGHRGESMSNCFSSDGFALLTASSETAKLWNRSSQQCIRTLQVNHAKSCLFVPGDRQVVIGTQQGSIEVHDVASGSVLERIDAHIGGVSCLVMYPSKSGLASGGLDKMVKFWDFDLVSDCELPASKGKRLILSQTRSLELDDQVLAIAISSDGRLVAVSLLDCSLKVFYVDTLKFFLSLYGHSLPANCLSISTDCSLLVSGSSDRNIKIWGLDFGDCHRSLFAHDDDVTSVTFVPGSHLFFSCGKDGLVKQWDADKFILVQVLKAHIGAVRAMCISTDGDFVATSGQDRSLRMWQRSQEIVIPDEEKEREREEEDEKLLARNKESIVPGEASSSEVGMATKTTIESIKATEHIMEAIELYREEDANEREFKASQRLSKDLAPYISQHPILRAYNNMAASKWVLQVLRKIKSSELEESLLVLPFSYVPDLLSLLNKFVKKGKEIELVCRCTFFLMRIHHSRVTSNQMLVQVLDELRANTENKIRDLRDTIGFNKAALCHLRRKVEQKNDIEFFADATRQVKEKRKKRKIAQLQRAVISL